MKKTFIKALCFVLVLLLPLPVQATSNATFNANAFSINGSGDSFTVTIGAENDTVLEAEHAAGRTAQATVDCEFPTAYVRYNNEVMESYVSGGKITFDIPSAGDYEIVRETRFQIANTNMVFGNSLAMNFWIRKSDLQGDGYYAVVVKNYADGRESAVSEIPFDQWENYDGNYYRVSCENIAAKEMSDEVSVQIFRNDDTPASYLYTDSIRSYAMDMLKYYRSGKLATALVDMLNYGAAAQSFFHYGEEDLANSRLTQKQQALATQKVQAQATGTSGGSYYTSSLSLNSNIVLNLYFEDVTEGMHAQVSFTDHYGEQQTQTIPFTEFAYNETAKKYAVQVENLVVADGKQPVTCVLYDGEAEVGRCTTSVEHYLSQMMKTTNADPLYAATWKFITSAYAYFH